jgi:hypothetical protein
MSPNYYAAFLLDPDGDNVEAVWLEQAEPPASLRVMTS